MAYTRAKTLGACCSSCAHGGSCLGDTATTPPVTDKGQWLALLAVGIGAFLIGRSRR